MLIDGWATWARCASFPHLHVCIPVVSGKYLCDRAFWATVDDFGNLVEVWAW
jgi:hypothetical protein